MIVPFQQYNQIARDKLTEALEGTRDYLVNRDCQNWDELSPGEQADTLSKAEKVAIHLLEKAVENLGGKDIPSSYDNGDLAMEVALLLPRPEFKINVLGKEYVIDLFDSPKDPPPMFEQKALQEK